jgi:hypothetical protein
MAQETLVETSPRPDSLPPPPSRFHRPWTVIIGLVFLLAPTLAYVAGDRARPIENRPLAPAPSLSDGWDFFPDAAAWFTDHLPLRRQAISTNRSITRRAFDEEPSYGALNTGLPAGVAKNENETQGKIQYPKVVVGKDGWLYIGHDFEYPCEPVRSVDEIFQGLARLEQLVTESGRRFVFTIAPDKSTIVPEHLPGTLVGKECAAARKREFWKRLDADPPASYFDLRAPLERQQDADGEPIYLKIDTHWGLHGAAVYAEELANALDPAIWKGTRVTRLGTSRSGGDLARLLGDSNRREPRTVWGVERPGVNGNFDEVGLSNDPVHVVNTTTGVSLFQPRTALLGDSFTDASFRAVYSLFADLVRVNNQQTDGALTARAVADADVVVFQVVERNIVSGKSAIISSDALELIESALASAPR